MADPSQPGDPDEPEEPETPSGSGGPHAPFGGIPGIPFGIGAGGPGNEFDLSQLDLSQIDLGQVMRMLQSDGPVNWEIARQTAEWVALEGRTESAVTAQDREQFDELSHAAQTLVVGETGLTATFGTQLSVLGRQGWVDLHLVALRPVLEAFATTLAETMRGEGDDADLDDEGFGGFPPGALGGLEGIAGLGGMGALAGMGNIVGLLAPALLGVQAGSLIGYLAQHALGRYDLPLPTGPAPTDTTPGGDAPSLCFVVPNIDAFEAAWSLPRADLRFYVTLHECVHAAARSVPWVRGALVRLALDFVSNYEIDPSAFEAEFGDIDPQDPSSLQSMAENPQRVLGAMHSARQDAPREALQRLTAVVEGYADLVLARIGHRLIPTFDQIHEAMQRHRVERGEAERFIEGLLGLKIERAHYDRGHAFCSGVVERGGLAGLNRLWEGEALLPTPSELEAPGLWLARIELPE